MMTKSLRSGMSFLLSFLMIATPSLSSAAPQGAIPEDLKELSAQEKVQELYELVRPARRDESFSEFYYRVSTRLTPEDAAFLNKKMHLQGQTKLPEIKLEKNEIVIKEQGRELRIGYSEKNEEPVITVNGKVLDEADFDSPTRRWAKLEAAISGKSAKHPLVMLLLPDAEAFPWVMAIAIGAALVGAYMLYKRNKKANEPAKCSVATPACCLVNGGYSMHSNSCCQEIGGLGAGATCPAGASGTSNTATPVPSGAASSTGQK